MLVLVLPPIAKRLFPTCYSQSRKANRLGMSQHEVIEQMSILRGIVCTLTLSHNATLLRNPLNILNTSFYSSLLHNAHLVLDPSPPTVTASSLDETALAHKSQLRYLHFDQCKSIGIDAVEWARSRGFQVSFSFPDMTEGRKVEEYVIRRLKVRDERQDWGTRGITSPKSASG